MRYLAIPLLVLGAGTTSFSGGAAAATEMSVKVLEEIIVTARKRDETIQQAPLSIAVLGNSALEMDGADTFESLQYRVANFSVAGESRRSNNTIAIRGIATQEDNAGLEVGFGMSVDGVIMGRMLAVSQDLVDLDRVEVLRGPQGTLQGKNTISGAISLISKKPPREFEGFANLDVGNYDYKRARLSVGGPLVEDKLLGKIVGYVADGDGYIKNVNTGATYNNPNAYGFRGQLEFLANDRLNILVAADWTERDRTMGPSEAVAFNSLAAGFPPVFSGPVVIVPEPYRVNTDGPSDELMKSSGVSGTITAQLGEGLELTSISAYRSAEATMNFDRDYTNQPLFHDLNFEDQRQLSQEVRIATTAGSAIDWVAGLLYFSQEVHEIVDLYTLTGFVPAIPAGAALFRDATVDTDSFAAFGQADFHVTERLTLGVGMRYTYEKKDMSYLQRVPRGFPFVAQDVSDDYSDGAFTFNAVARYAVSDRVNAYALISNGFKSGGWNLGEAETIVTADPLDPEYVLNYELGVKGVYFDGRLAANLSAFHMRYSDQQVRDCGSTCATEVIQNAATSTINGFELEGVIKATDYLNMDFGVGYADATFKDFSKGSIDLSGKRLTYAPEWSANAGINFERSIGSLGDFVFRGGATYRGDQYQDTANTRRTASVTLINARTGIRSADGRWGAYVWGKNLADKLYITSPRVFDLMGTYHESYGEPRTYGLSADVKF